MKCQLWSIPRRWTKVVEKVYSGSKQSNLSKISQPPPLQMIWYHLVIVYIPKHPCMVYLPTFTNKHQPNVSKYTIHGLFGIYSFFFNTWRPRANFILKRNFPGPREIRGLRPSKNACDHDVRITRTRARFENHRVETLQILVGVLVYTLPETTVCTWKWMVGILSFPFRECIVSFCWGQTGWCKHPVERMWCKPLFWGLELDWHFFWILMY